MEESFRKNNMHVQVIKFWNNQVSAESKKKPCFPLENFSKFKTACWHLYYIEASCIYLTFDNLDLSTIRKWDENRRYGYWIILYKSNLLIDTLTEEIVTVASIENEFEDQAKRIRPNLIFWLVFTISFPLQGSNCIVWHSSNVFRVEKFRLLKNWTKRGQ